MAIPNFNVDFVIKSFGYCDLKFYMALIHNASKDDLISLRKEIKLHKKTNRQNQAFSNVKNLSTHDALISAINHELLKKTFFYSPYKFFLRLRAPIVKTFTGLELKEDKDFGTLYTQPKYISHFYLHMSHKEFIPRTCKFIKVHWVNILLIIAAFIGAFATLYSALKNGKH